MSAVNLRSTEPDSGLSRQHRAWIALYSLELNEQTCANILQLNQVTEEDLTVFRPSWLKMRRSSANAVAKPRQQALDADDEAE